MPIDSQALILQHVCNAHEHNPVDACGIILLCRIFLMFKYFSGLEATSQILHIGDLERVGLDLFFTGRVFWILIMLPHKTNRMKSYFVIIHNGIVKLVYVYFAVRWFYNKSST